MEDNAGAITTMIDISTLVIVGLVGVAILSAVVLLVNIKFVEVKRSVRVDSLSGLLQQRGS